MDISEQEKQEIKALLDRGEALPSKYRWKLFATPRETELIWPGKTGEVTNVVLPFQVIEHVDEPRVEREATTADFFATDARSGRQSGGWTNKLIWGDNKLVLSSLKNGPLRREIEAAGGLKLVYIDPPFDVGADFSFEIEVGEDSLTKDSSIIEDVAYRDTWGRGYDSYVAMIYERIRLIHQLLAEDGSLLVHCDTRVNQLIRLVCDEVFGRTSFRNEIGWVRSSSHNDATGQFGKVKDHILYYSKSAQAKLNILYTAYSTDYIDAEWNLLPSGRYWKSENMLDPRNSMKEFDFHGTKARWRTSPEKMEEYWNAPQTDVPNSHGRIKLGRNGNPIKRCRIVYIDELPGVPLGDVWTDIPYLAGGSREAVGYKTQKPEGLLNRIIEATTNRDELIADFFCGSGTALAAGEKLGRKWIGCDLGRFAIHTSRKRLINVQRALKNENKPYRSFEILNLGKYERQYFAGIDPTLPEDQRRILSIQKEEHFTGLILMAYKAERVFQSPPFHGRKGGALVCVGPIDAPVTESLIAEAVAAARKLGVTQVDVLGFEFEMGVIPRVVEEARARGIRIATRYIPKDVFDKRAVEKGQVTFYDVAYLDVRATLKGDEVTVSLIDFAVSYRQEDADVLAGEMKPGGSKVTVDGGQVVKITKDKKGIVTREILTKQWTDWIDYWSVDFDYHSKQEVITVTSPDATGKMMDRPQWTGGYIFENIWQSFRTRRDRKLELTSIPHEYPAKGRYHVAVKVIDIFGNDTTKVVEVVV